MAFTAITTGQVDADSPLDTTLMDLVRTNLDDHQSRLTTVEESYVSTAHDHTGGDGAAIPQGGLKTTSGSVYTQTSANLTLPGGEYGFYPRVRAEDAGTAISFQVGNSITATSYATNIYISGGGGANLGGFALQRYIQASPPYKIGSNTWGHFLFILRDIATATVKAAYEAEDPPWAYNGAVWLPKDDVGRLSEVPHPFADYWQKDPAVDGLEIVMVDLTAYNTKTWKQDNAKLGKGILEDIGSVVKGKGKNKSHADYGLPAIPKFTDKVKIIIP